MQAGLLIVAAAFLTSILSGIFGMAGGLVFMGVLALILPVTIALALHGVIQFASNAWRVALHRAHVAWPVLLWFGIGAAASIGFFSLVIFTPTKFYVFLGLGLMPILVWLPNAGWRSMPATAGMRSAAASSRPASRLSQAYRGRSPTCCLSIPGWAGIRSSRPRR